MLALHTWESFVFEVIGRVALHSRDIFPCSCRFTTSLRERDERSVALRASLLSLRKRERKITISPLYRRTDPRLNWWAHKRLGVSHIVGMPIGNKEIAFLRLMQVVPALVGSNASHHMEISRRPIEGRRALPFLHHGCHSEFGISYSICR